MKLLVLFVIASVLITSSFSRDHEDLNDCMKGETPMTGDGSHPVCEKKCLQPLNKCIPKLDMCICKKNLVRSEFSGNCVQRSECTDDFLQWHKAELKNEKFRIIRKFELNQKLINTTINCIRPNRPPVNFAKLIADIIEI